VRVARSKAASEWPRVTGTDILTSALACQGFSHRYSVITHVRIIDSVITHVRIIDSVITHVSRAPIS
jgi:hypothetical protein